MKEFKKNRVWLSIARCGNFSAEDKTIFRVYPIVYEKNTHVDCMPKFIEADDMESARLQAHRFIDKIFNEMYSVRTSNEPAVPTTPAVIQPDLINADSLSIESTPQSSSDNLLNLKDLL
jgi:hypothetical protein